LENCGRWREVYPIGDSKTASFTLKFNVQQPKIKVGSTLTELPLNIWDSPGFRPGMGNYDETKLQFIVDGLISTDLHDDQKITPVAPDEAKKIDIIIIVMTYRQIFDNATLQDVAKVYQQFIKDKPIMIVINKFDLVEGIDFYKHGHRMLSSNLWERTKENLGNKTNIKSMHIRPCVCYCQDHNYTDQAVPLIDYMVFSTLYDVVCLADTKMMKENPTPGPGLGGGGTGIKKAPGKIQKLFVYDGDSENFIGNLKDIQSSEKLTKIRQKITSCFDAEDLPEHFIFITSNGLPLEEDKEQKETVEHCYFLENKKDTITVKKFVERSIQKLLIQDQNGNILGSLKNIPVKASTAKLQQSIAKELEVENFKILDADESPVSVKQMASTTVEECLIQKGEKFSVTIRLTK